MALLDLRKALTPVHGADGRLLAAQAEVEPPTMARATEAVRTAEALYGANDFGATLASLPGLLAETRALVELASADDQPKAFSLVSQTYQVAARLLVQLRAHDLAYMATIAGRQAAEQSRDRLTQARAIGPMCWLLLRQARLAEAEALAVDQADQLEPDRISRADIADVAAWGWLLVEASAAAMRDGRDDTAQELLALADVAATRVGSRASGPMVYGFGTGKVTALRIESAAIAHNPLRVLELTAAAPPNPTSMRASCWQRHRLDVAWAHAQLGQHGEAENVLADLGDRAPTWLRHQRYAKDVITSISTSRKRAMSDRLANLARLVGAAA